MSRLASPLICPNLGVGPTLMRRVQHAGRLRIKSRTSATTRQSAGVIADNRASRQNRASGGGRDTVAVNKVVVVCRRRGTGPHQKRHWVAPRYTNGRDTSGPDKREIIPLAGVESLAKRCEAHSMCRPQEQRCQRIGWGSRLAKGLEGGRV